MLSVIVLISNADVIMLSVIMVHFSEFKMPMYVIFLMSNADVIMLKVILLSVAPLRQRSLSFYS